MIEIHQGSDGQWYWRLRAANGKIVADGAEGYVHRANARRAARTAQKIMATAAIAVRE